MKKLNVVFYIIVIVTSLFIITVASGKLDNNGTRYYLGGAGVLILYFSIRTFILMGKSSNTIEKVRLNVFDKICGYVGLINGFVFCVIGLIALIIVAINLLQSTVGEIVVPFLAILYGYSLIYYIRYTLKNKFE